MRPRLARIATVAGVLAACADDVSEGEPPPSGTVAEEESGAPPQAPVLSWDGARPVKVSTHRGTDLEFAIAENGQRTALVLDGVRLSHSLSGPVATLTASKLSLHFSGAMLPGAHTLQLQWADPDHVSEVVELSVVAEPNAGLAVEWLQDLGTATRLLSGGREDGGALGLMREDLVPATVAVFAARDEGWEAAAHGFSLPGFASLYDAVAVGNASPPHTVPWAAWTQGQVPRAVVWAEPGRPQERVLDLDALVTPHEFAALGRLRFVGESLFVERTIFADVEAPRPADATLVQIRSVAGVRGVPEELAMSTAHDALAPTSVVDSGLWRWQQRHLLLAHRPHTVPVLLSLGTDGQLREEVGPPASAMLTDVQVAAAFAGAFDTRIFVVRREGTPNWQLVTVVLASGETPRTFDLGISADAFPSCHATQLGGHPVLVFPRRSDTPAWAVLVDTPTPTPIELPDLQCDDLVLRSSMVADRRQRAALACLRDNQTQLGILSLRTGPARD